MSKIDIAIGDNSRHQIAAALKDVLADTFVLYFKTHTYHWNVEGNRFSSLHSFFEEQYRELWDSLDVLAERMRALGAYAPTSAADLVQTATIPEAQKAPAQDAMIKDLVEGHEATVRRAREAIQTAEAGGDDATVDLLTQRCAAHEKAAWMLRSHLAA